MPISRQQAPALAADRLGYGVIARGCAARGEFTGAV